MIIFWLYLSVRSRKERVPLQRLLAVAVAAVLVAAVVVAAVAVAAVAVVAEELVVGAVADEAVVAEVVVAAMVRVTRKGELDAVWELLALPFKFLHLDLTLFRLSFYYLS
jgi:tryptophan 2,3-dioxygenase